uniref:LAGLIDADG family homing endonuclease n=1 Tax=Mycolicibacterium vaccae TaxID=1810 RepID=UPI00058CDB2E
MRSREQFEEVLRLISTGLNDCEIARQTGIPRKTVWQWRCEPGAGLRARAGSPECGIEHNFAVLPAKPYAYLLGLYLGDGCVSRGARTFTLRISCDKRYTAIIQRCREAIDALFPGQRAGVYARKSGCADVYHCSKHWPCLLPQHGPGRKHLRKIALEQWQQEIVDRETAEFVTGLIHSDGCRVVANDRGVLSVRYHFSNRSEDIIGLFTAALDRLGITWRRSDRYTVSVYRKAATARLDEFIGPKDRALPLHCA